MMKELFAIITVIFLISGASTSIPFFASNNFSYCVETEGENSNWFIVEIHANETIHIDEIYVNMAIDVNSSIFRWCVFLERFFIIGENGKWWVPPMVLMLKQGSFLDWYFQIDMFGMNFSYSHLIKKPVEAHGSCIYHVYNVSLSPGKWYLVSMIFPTNKSHIKVCINGTNAKLGNATEGSTSFILENEDFHAKLNLKSIPFSIILDGRKTVHINNTFIGFIYAPASIIAGVAHLKFITPDGEEKEAIIWETPRKFYIENSDFIPIFEPIVGNGGEWKFYVSMAGIGMATVNIFAADVILP